MQKIKVYDLEYEYIADICEENNVNEYDVIEAIFNMMLDKNIDITEWL